MTRADPLQNQVSRGSSSFGSVFLCVFLQVNFIWINHRKSQGNVSFCLNVHFVQNWHRTPFYTHRKNAIKLNTYRRLQFCKPFPAQQPANKTQLKSVKKHNIVTFCPFFREMCSSRNESPDPVQSWDLTRVYTTTAHLRWAPFTQNTGFEAEILMCDSRKTSPSSMFSV